jgi:hypothetical protein
MPRTAVESSAASSSVVKGPAFLFLKLLGGRDDRGACLWPVVVPGARSTRWGHS